jgi:hypothetical protein
VQQAGQGEGHCLYLNRLLGNPDWLQIKGLAFPS